MIKLTLYRPNVADPEAVKTPIWINQQYIVAVEEWDNGTTVTLLTGSIHVKESPNTVLAKMKVAKGEETVDKHLTEKLSDLAANS